MAVHADQAEAVRPAERTSLHILWRGNREHQPARYSADKVLATNLAAAKRPVPTQPIEHGHIDTAITSRVA